MALLFPELHSLLRKALPAGEDKQKAIMKNSPGVYHGGLEVVHGISAHILLVGTIPGSMLKRKGSGKCNSGPGGYFLNC